MSTRVIFHKLGHKSETGAILVFHEGKECYVSDWCWKGAPFWWKPANGNPAKAAVMNQHGNCHDVGKTHEEAARYVEELNTLAALAVFFKEG